MNKAAYMLALLLAVAIAVGACKGDDDIEYSSDCYIKAFTLGGLRRAVHSTTTAGNDTTYYTSVTGSAFPMSIDHVNGRITNAAPLPSGTRLEAITATVSAQGLVVYAPAADTTSWVQFNSSDSIDYSGPVIFRVIASDGHSYRDYTVTLSTRSNNADEYTWTSLGTIPGVDGDAAVKLVLHGTTPILLMSDGSGQCSAMPLDVFAAGDVPQPCAGLPSTADIRSAVAFGGALWLTNVEGQLFTSADGLAWSPVAADGHLRLSTVVASRSAIYATADSDGETHIVYSADGRIWEQMPTETVFRKGTLAAVAYTQVNGNRRVLLTSAAEGADVADVWSLLEGFDTAWTLFSDDVLNAHRLPATQPRSIVAYDDKLIALGADSILLSHDNGITWKTDTYLKPPTGVTEVQTAVAVGEYIYAIADKQLWQVRLNSYGE